MAKDEDSFNNAGLNEFQLANAIMRLLGRQYGRSDKFAKDIALNPDFKRSRFYLNYAKRYGFDDIPVVKEWLDGIEIEGKTIGIHGNDLSCVPLTELTRLELATAPLQEDKKVRKSGLLGENLPDVLSHSDNIEDREISIERKRLLKQEKINTLKSEIENLKQQLDIEQKRQKITINQNTNGLPEEDKNKKEDK